MNSEELSMRLLENALQVANLRQRVYANNIANMDTPGFKRQDVQFESLLQAALQGAAPAHLGQRYIPIGGTADWQSALAVQPVVVQDNTTTVDNNGNNVDVDAEMARLAENQIRYNALVQDVTMRLERMRNAINGG